MESKLKARWVKALRSGRYKQTRNTYESNGSYCCLGVLVCVVYGGAQVSNRTCCNWWDSKRATNMFPDQREDVLINMNDSGKSFETIANYIEKKL